LSGFRQLRRAQDTLARDGAGGYASRCTGIEALGTERGHRTLALTRKGGKKAVISLAPRTAREATGRKAAHAGAS
jgi:hypothetical protein